MHLQSKQIQLICHRIACNNDGKFTQPCSQNNERHIVSTKDMLVYFPKETIFEYVLFLSFFEA